MADFIHRASITGEQIADLWEKHAPRYAGSYGRISDARDLLIGRKKAPLPDVIAKRPDGDAFRVDTAQKYVATMQLINKLSNPWPVLTRDKTATSDLGERTASRIERFVNPAVRSVLSNRDLTELLLVESEACALVIPEAARWRKGAGEYYRTDVSDEQKKAALTDKTTDRHLTKIIRPDFLVDSRGRAYHDLRSDAIREYGDDFDPEKFDAGFDIDTKRSSAAYAKHVRHLRARNYPFDVELISRLQMVPINPRIKGTNVEVDGIIVRTRLAASDAIKRRYVVKGLKAHTEPTSETEGDIHGSGDLWQYLYVGADQDDDGELYPYFAYSLMGRATEIKRDGFDAKAVIDLRKQCGLRSLPIVYGYGWRWFATNADDRAIPYTFPFGRSWLATDAFLTGKAYAGWAEGMLAWFMQMPDSIKDTAMQQAWLEFVKTNPLVIEPFKILPVWGEMKPATHTGTGRDVNEMVAALQGSNSNELVNPLARGGGQAGSAIERTVVSADTVAGVSDIQGTTLAMTARVGELILEVCTGISRIHGHDVLIYGNPETPTDQAGSSSGTRAIIELKAHWLGPKDQESFDLVAEYPEELGTKLAEKAQLFGFFKEGGITFEDWCKAIGEHDPVGYRAQLIYDQWVMDPSPTGGRAIVMMDAAKYAGDVEMVEAMEAQKKGALGPGGQPMGMLAGLNPPTGALPAGSGVQDPGAQAAIGMQDPAQAQAAAIAGAARNADAAAVGPVPTVGPGMV